MKKISLLFVMIWSGAAVAISMDLDWRVSYVDRGVQHTDTIKIDYFSLDGNYGGLYYPDGEGDGIIMGCSFVKYPNSICVATDNGINKSFLIPLSSEWFNDGAYALGNDNDYSALSLFTKQTQLSGYRVFRPSYFNDDTGYLLIDSVRYKNNEYRVVLRSEDDGSFSLYSAESADLPANITYNGIEMVVQNVMYQGNSYRVVFEMLSSGNFGIKAATLN